MHLPAGQRRRSHWSRKWQAPFAPESVKVYEHSSKECEKILCASVISSTYV
jgi:hypothetical protein